MNKSFDKKRTLFPLIVILVVSALQPALSGFAAPAPQTTYAETLEEYVQKQMQTYKIPGMAVAIVRSGHVEYLKGFGVANARGDLVTADTPFLLASLTKSMTALAVMQLVEAGKLNLDDPVQKHLPWFDVPGGQGHKITIAQLLYHTSGLSEWGGLQATIRPDAPDALEAGVRDLKTFDLGSTPGSKWEYSNSNYNVLGLLIEQASGQSYEEYIREHIFVPLEMKNSHTSLSAARAAGAASGYYPLFGIPLPYDNYMRHSRATLPSGGLWSSASDLSRYLIAHLNDGKFGGAVLLSPANTARLHKPGAAIDSEFGYAMGWFHANGFLARDFLDTLDTDLKNYGDLETLWHEGDWENYKAVALLLPGLDYGVVILMNTNAPPILSVFKNFAWDVTLIATGGQAQYFPPGEDFIVRNSRLVFGAVTLLLIGGMMWSLWTLRQIRAGHKGKVGPRRLLFYAGLPLLIDLALVGYVFFKLLPDNNLSLPIVWRAVPDIGTLFILILLLAIGWGVARTILFAVVWIRQPRPYPVELSVSASVK